jgi:hypothetical protein
MFGLFTSKRKKQLFEKVSLDQLAWEINPSQGIDESKSVDNIQLPFELEKLTKSKDELARLDWNYISRTFSELPDEQQSRFDDPKIFNKIQCHWLSNLAKQLGTNYQLSQSNHFLLLSDKDEKQLDLIFQFLESAYQRILKKLTGIAKPRDGDRLVVLLFDEIERYYQYINDYYPNDGEYQMSSGVFLSEGLGHFALPDTEMSSLESVVAHELTHALVNHLNIPLWVNEGLAVNTEMAITGFSPYLLNKHIDYWNAKTIQEFWLGSSFSKPGEPSDLSYHLAQLLVRSLSQDYQQFTQFVNKADHHDAGEAAAIEVFGGSLGELIESIYGEGDWSPKRLQGGMHSCNQSIELPD